MFAEVPDGFSGFLGDRVRSYTANLQKLSENLERIASLFRETVFIHPEVVVSQDYFFVHYNFELGFCEVSFETVYHLHVGIFPVPLHPVRGKIYRLNVNVVDSEVGLAVFTHLNVGPSKELSHQVRPWDEFWKLNLHQCSVVCLLLCCSLGGTILCFGLRFRRRDFSRWSLLLVSCYFAKSLYHRTSKLPALGEACGTSAHLSGTAKSRSSLAPKDT
mmetsp:Transcript_4240/g.5647  ORF Transcript_4240/g.5647 Transcript_4240/m.5647 type:complete len:217 (+) Transcript_4240:249-899(+)